MRRKIGVFRLSESKEFTTHYETAAWYQKVLVEAGDYDAFLLTDGYPWVVVRLTGTVTSSYFPTLWGGVVVGNRGIDERVGKTADHGLQYNPYMIARLFLDKHPNWIPDQGVEFYEKEFESFLEPGKMMTTTKLVVDGKEYS